MIQRFLALVVANVFAVSLVFAQANHSAQPIPQTLTLAQALHYALDHYPSVQSALEVEFPGFSGQA